MRDILQKLSWVVKLMPCGEEGHIHLEMRKKSRNFTLRYKKVYVGSLIPEKKIVYWV